MWSVVSPGGTFVKVKPWMELPDEDIFIIRLDKVITMTESNDKKLINLYNHYINDEEPIYKEKITQIAKEKKEKKKSKKYLDSLLDKNFLKKYFDLKSLN